MPYGTGSAIPIANLVAKYDAYTISSVHVTSGHVLTWDDISGNGNNATNPASPYPTYTVGTSVDFNTGWLRAAISGLNQPVTVYIVYEILTYHSNDYIIDGYTSGDIMTLYESNSGSPYYIQQYAGGYGGQITVPALSTYYVNTAVFNGASSTLSINDGTKSTGSGSANPGGIIIGCRYGGTSNSKISVKCILIYNVAHSSATQTTMFNSLKSYYSVP
jgi:hypothetical protein